MVEVCFVACALAFLGWLGLRLSRLPGSAAETVASARDPSLVWAEWMMAEQARFNSECRRKRLRLRAAWPAAQWIRT